MLITVFFQFTLLHFANLRFSLATSPSRYPGANLTSHGKRSFSIPIRDAETRARGHFGTQFCVTVRLLCLVLDECLALAERMRRLIIATKKAVEKKKDSPNSPMALSPLRFVSHHEIVEGRRRVYFSALSLGRKDGEDVVANS